MQPSGIAVGYFRSRLDATIASSSRKVTFVDRIRRPISIDRGQSIFFFQFILMNLFFSNSIERKNLIPSANPQSEVPLRAPTHSPSSNSYIEPVATPLHFPLSYFLFRSSFFCFFFLCILSFNVRSHRVRQHFFSSFFPPPPPLPLSPAPGFLSTVAGNSLALRFIGFHVSARNTTREKHDFFFQTFFFLACHFLFVFSNSSPLSCCATKNHGMDVISCDTSPNTISTNSSKLITRPAKER